MVVMKHFSLYSIFDRIPVRHSYATKVLIAALVATMAPVLLLSGVLLMGNGAQAIQFRFFLVVLTILATATFTVWAVRSLLRPVEMLEEFVETYVSTGEITELPEDCHDDLGALMRETRKTVLRLDLSTKELEEASKIDILTGLHNRKFSSQRLQQDVSRANRDGKPISLIAIDLDDFKRLNQKYGSAVGDACLQHFTELAKSCVREGDWIARWGGDEFLVLLWDANARQTEAVINRIRKELAQSKKMSEAGIRLSASFGYTTHAPGDQNFELFTKADAALRRAKQQGKNQTVGTAATRAYTG